MQSRLGLYLGLLMTVAGWYAWGETGGTMAAKQLPTMSTLDEVLIPAQDVAGVTGRTVKVFRVPPISSAGQSWSSRPAMAAARFLMPKVGRKLRSINDYVAVAIT